MTEIIIQLTNLHVREACRRGHPYAPGSFTFRTLIRGDRTYQVRDCILCRRVRESRAARASEGLSPRQPKKS